VQKRAFNSVHHYGQLTNGEYSLTLTAAYLAIYQGGMRQSGFSGG
jgi:hypothetical protein